MEKTFLTTKDTKVTKEKNKSKVFLKPFVYVVSSPALAPGASVVFKDREICHD
jgi:hypothetical protein